MIDLYVFHHRFPNYTKRMAAMAIAAQLWMRRDIPFSLELK